MMKKAFYFILKVLFVLNFCLDYGHVDKSLDWTVKANFEIHDVTTSLTKNCNNIAQYLIN